MYPLRVTSEAFYRTVCELAMLQQGSLLAASKGCGESEDAARVQLAGTVLISKKYTRLTAALADVKLLNVALWDAQQYAESLLYGGHLPAKDERRNCLQFIARCREYRRQFIGRNVAEEFVAASTAIDIHDLMRTAAPKSA